MPPEASTAGSQIWNPPCKDRLDQNSPYWCLPSVMDCTSHHSLTAWPITVFVIEDIRRPLSCRRLHQAIFPTGFPHDLQKVHNGLDSVARIKKCQICLSQTFALWLFLTRVCGIISHIMKRWKDSVHLSKPIPNSHYY